MKLHFFTIIISALLLASCNEQETGNEKPTPVDWKEKKINVSMDDKTIHQSYLSVYSHIYSYSAHKSFNLTATISIRNTSTTDSLFIFNADYYDSHGKLITHFNDSPFYISPMETIEFVIEEKDNKGGSGANVLFDWTTNDSLSKPLFQAVMISTYNQQGLSFVTDAIQIK